MTATNQIKTFILVLYTRECASLVRSFIEKGTIVILFPIKMSLKSIELVYNWKLLHYMPSKKHGRQNHALTQWNMLHCKTVVNIITYHHVV
jgi:hypothetical protein